MCVFGSDTIAFRFTYVYSEATQWCVVVCILSSSLFAWFRIKNFDNNNGTLFAGTMKMYSLLIDIIPNNYAVILMYAQNYAFRFFVFFCFLCKCVSCHMITNLFLNMFYLRNANILPHFF